MAFDFLNVLASKEYILRQNLIDSCLNAARKSEDDTIRLSDLVLDAKKPSSRIENLLSYLTKMDT